MPELVVTLKDRELSRHQLGAQTRIGREPSCEVFIDNVGISRHHATIRAAGGAFELIDAGSQNGVYVNGTRIHRHQLKDGDMIQLGKFILTFTAAGAPLVAAAPKRAGGRPLPTDARGSLQQTFALRPEDVEKLLAASTPPPPPLVAPESADSQAPPLHTSQEGSDSPLLLILAGVGGLVIVGFLVYLFLN